MMYSSPVCLTLRNNKSMDVTSSVIFLLHDLQVATFESLLLPQLLFTDRSLEMTKMKVTKAPPVE